MEIARPQVEVHYEEPAELERENAAYPWYKGPMVRRILIAVAVALVVLLIYFNWGWLTGKVAAGKLSATNNAVLVPSETSTSSSSEENSKIVMDRAEVDRLRAQASAAGRPSAVPMVANQPSMTAPSTDSQSALAVNGQTFGGARYQFYRQGNLTWRLDTDSGMACVIFATDEEWRKPKVYRHGCRS